MDFKLCLILVLTSICGFASAIDKYNVDRIKISIWNAVNDMGYEEYNSVMWLHRMLTEKNRWNSWRLTEDVKEEEADFVRGLAAYASALYSEELLRHWDYGIETGGLSKKEEYGQFFEQKIVKSCKLAVDHLAVPLKPVKKSQIEGHPIEFSEETETWIANDRDCQKILDNPKHWIHLSFKVAEENHLLVVNTKPSSHFN